MRSGHLDYETGKWVDDPPPADAGVPIRAADLGLASPTSIVGTHAGMVTPGNIDLTNRPDTTNPDGSHSSVRSMSFSDGGPEILVPTIADNGRQMTDDEAIDQYRKTGQHLGQFDTPENATAYADKLHRQQAGELNAPGSPVTAAVTAADKARAIKARQGN